MSGLALCCPARAKKAAAMWPAALMAASTFRTAATDRSVKFVPTVMLVDGAYAQNAAIAWRMRRRRE
jgi:hypothetical protein